MTNGLGGFACGTVAGANTRRYHGLLVASLRPPVERTLLVAKIELSVHYLDVETDLSANEFAENCLRPAHSPYKAQALPEAEAARERRHCQAVKMRLAELRTRLPRRHRAA